MEPYALQAGEGWVYRYGIDFEHGYTMRSEGDVRLLTMSFPTRAATGSGWGGFMTDIKCDGEPVAAPGPTTTVVFCLGYAQKPVMVWCFGGRVPSGRRQNTTP